MAGVIHIELGLKNGYMYVFDWLWSVNEPALRLKTIPDLLDTNITHRDIAYVHFTAPQSCDYMSYVRHVGHAAKSSKNHM